MKLSEMMLSAYRFSKFREFTCSMNISKPLGDIKLALNMNSVNLLVGFDFIDVPSQIR